MAGSQISTSVTILNSLHGFMALSLTEYSTSAAASIAAGSVVEIAGAFFTFAGDEAINASSWTSIVTGTTAYITLTPSGTAGSQIVDAAYTSTAPTWRDDFQGWYASAASSVRVVGTVYKAESTRYINKEIYTTFQESRIKASGITSNGIPIIPYRITTETYIKAGYSTDTITTVTSITSYGIIGGYCTLSTAPTSLKAIGSYVSANTIYVGSAGIGSFATDTTFIITYLY